MKSAKRLAREWFEHDTRGVYEGSPFPEMLTRYASWILDKIRARRDEIFDEDRKHDQPSHRLMDFWDLFDDDAEFGPDHEVEITVSQEDVLGPCEKVKIHGMTHIVEQGVADAIRADERRKIQEGE